MADEPCGCCHGLGRVLQNEWAFVDGPDGVREIQFVKQTETDCPYCDGTGVEPPDEDEEPVAAE